MQDDHRQRHHRLRSGYRCRLCRLRGKIHSEKDWHADSYQKHKEERDCCRHIAFDLRINMLMPHHHTQYKRRQQDLDMDAGIFAIKVFGHPINRLRNPAGKDGIEKNCLPILPHVITAHLSPSDDQKDHHDQNDNAQLPAQAYHHNLQRNHQQNRIKVVEDCQYLHLLVYPRRFQPCRRQHCKQYTG